MSLVQRLADGHQRWKGFQRIDAELGSDRMGECGCGQCLDQDIHRWATVVDFMRKKSGARIAREVIIELIACKFVEHIACNQKRKRFRLNLGVCSIECFRVKWLQGFMPKLLDWCREFYLRLALSLS